MLPTPIEPHLPDAITSLPTTDTSPSSSPTPTPRSRLHSLPFFSKPETTVVKRVRPHPMVFAISS